MSKVPEHRHQSSARSGDAIQIGKDGEAVNLDEQRRKSAEADATKAKPASSKPSTKKDTSKKEEG